MKLFALIRAPRGGALSGPALLLVALLSWLATADPSRAEEARPANPDATAADLLSSTTVGYVELSDPPQLVERLVQHPLGKKLEQNATVQQLLDSPQVIQARLGLGFVQLGLGMTWRELVSNLSAGGVYAAIDLDSHQPVLMLRAKDAATLERFREKVFKLVRDDARGKGRPDPIEAGEHRGVRGYRVDQASLVTLGPWLVVAQKSEALRPIIDAWLDGRPQSLAKDSTFSEARRARPADAFAWGFVRLDKLRDAGLAPPLVKGSTDNPVAELLVGGVMSTLQKTSHVSVAWTLENDRTRLIVSAPHQDDFVPQPRKFFFGPGGKGPAPAPLAVPGRLAYLRAWRDIGGMWAAAPDLFDERVNGELAQANSNLSTILGGKDFGQDVLESLGAELQLVAARARFEAGAPTPAIKLPAFGFTTRLRDPESSKRLWKVMFQTLIGFINIGGGMQGLPLLELETEKIDDVSLVIGRYVPPEKLTAETIVGLHYNFAPTLAIIDDRLILASNRQMAVDLLKAIRGAGAAPANGAAETVNTELSVEAGVLREILVDNQKQLVAQNMLEKGHDRAAAEKEIGALLTIAEFFRGVGFSLRTDEKTLRGEAEVRFAVE